MPKLVCDAEHTIINSAASGLRRWLIGSIAQGHPSSSGCSFSRFASLTVAATSLFSRVVLQLVRYFSERPFIYLYLDQFFFACY